MLIVRKGGPNRAKRGRWTEGSLILILISSDRAETAGATTNTSNSKGYPKSRRSVETRHGGVRSVIAKLTDLLRKRP
jgi:hypothetical protein